MADQIDSDVILIDSDVYLIDQSDTAVGLPLVVAVGASILLEQSEKASVA